MSSDPSIRPWKTTKPQAGYPDWWPLWKSPDVFVDNNDDKSLSSDLNGSFEYYKNVDDIGEPLKGSNNNQLFALIRNLGDEPADNVEVKFSYTPWYIGIDQNNLHFKEIGAPIIEHLDGPAEMLIGTNWDLSDLTENNNGQWPFPIEMYDHFCVKVHINYTNDVDPSNNETQHNFFTVDPSSSGTTMPFLVVNAAEIANSGKITAVIPQGFVLGLRGIDKIKSPFSVDKWKSGQKFVLPKRTPEEKAGNYFSLVQLSLRPNEVLPITLTVIPPKQIRETQFVEISFMVDGKAVGGASFGIPKEKPRIGPESPPRIVPRRKPVLVPIEISRR